MAAIAAQIVQPPGAEAWALANRQHGVVTRRQLLALGLSPAAVKHRITTARLHPVHPGVYAVGRRTALRSGDRTLHHRIPVTTPFATIVDLAARLGESELEAAINEADKLSLINPESLRARRRDRIGGR